MTQSPLDPPNDPTSPRETNLSTSRPSAGSRSDDRSTGGPSRPLTFDEVVALFVAFLSLGSVFLWGMTRGGLGLFTESLASADTSLISPNQESDAAEPFAFGLGRNDDADDDATDAEVASPSAAAEEETRVAAGVTNPAPVQKEPRKRGTIWNDVKAGMAGAAVGITGAAVTPEETAAAEAPDVAIADPDPLPPVAADSAAAPLSAEATAEPKEAVAFNDVPDNYWAKPYIDAMSSRGLMSGFEGGDFKPDQPLTRAEIANIVSRTFVLTDDKENLEFSDVESDYWARESIGEVVKGGFMTGFPNDTFAPGEPVTRAQALTTLVTGLGIEPPTNEQSVLDRYEDANTIPNWATGKMAAATSGGLVVNYPNLQQLNPTQPTTRAELAAFIYQALAKKEVIKDPVESEYVIKP